MVNSYGNFRKETLKLCELKQQTKRNDKNYFLFVVHVNGEYRSYSNFRKETLKLCELRL